ncbi:MAG: biotin-dependent carboxyltransferase family protein [Flavobacteriaceae bacterium]|nr:biotin-dependent carboxyltransferase family protein [Flavobacteriaceae bacterium]
MIKMISSGLYSSLQDLGRFGYRNDGVPWSGAMDLSSMKMANSLVGNREGDTVMEFTATGPSLFFEEETTIAISGGEFEPDLEGSKIPQNKAIKVPAKSTLHLGIAHSGIRGYLAVKGGFIAEKVLGSSSFYNGITEKATLKKGDTLSFPIQVPSTLETITSAQKTNFDANEIEVYKGPEYIFLSDAAQQELENQVFTVGTDSNRMAYVLEYQNIVYANEILTAPVQPGTVQLTPAGKLVVLMRDSQTTGGYSRVLQLTESAIDMLAQKRAGEEVRFRISDLPFGILV